MPTILLDIDFKGVIPDWHPACGRLAAATSSKSRIVKRTCYPAINHKRLAAGAGAVRYPTARRKSSLMARAGPGKTVLVPIANGSEEIEAVTIIDTLRRAGAEVIVASVEKDLQVSMSRHVNIVADKFISDLGGQSFDLIALPGGMPGAERLRDSQDLLKLLREQQASDRYVTAICAAPAVVLEAQGLLAGRKATCHPGFTDKLSDKSNIDTRVVIDGKVITSRGPGTALEFSLSLVHQLFGKEKADEVASPMVIGKGMEY